MNNFKIRFFLILTTIVVLIPLLIYHFSEINFDFNNEQDQDNNQDAEDNSEKETTLYWGVDSASYTEEALYQCVVENFGEPEIWGRYLEDRAGVSYGLDSEEIQFLHNKDISILVIYNHINDARGYEHGVEHANQAISFANNLGIPEGIAIFGDIEPNYPVDAAFMEAWYDTLETSIYEPAIYGVFDDESELTVAFEAMPSDVQENTILWTAYPQREITTKENAPDYNPEAPNSAPIIGWQYAIDAEVCNIDTNLFHSDMLNYLWSEN